MKATCEDVAELGLEIANKRREMRQMQEQWAREVDDLQEDLGVCRAHSDWLEQSRDAAQRELAKVQDDAARLEVRLEAARKELRDEVERRKKSYQELERHVLNWLAVGDVFELTCERAAFMDVAGESVTESVTVVLPVGHQVSVVELPGLAYQVKLEGHHPADPLNNPPARLTAPLGDLRLVSKRSDGGALDLGASVAHLQEAIDQLTVLIDMGAGVHGPAKEMREIAQAVQQAAGEALGELRRGGRGVL